jgi:hypothetical protein
MAAQVFSSRQNLSTYIHAGNNEMGLLKGFGDGFGYKLSSRDIEELLAARGVQVGHATIHRWVYEYAPQLVSAFLDRKRPVADSWRMDETCVKVKGKMRTALGLKSAAAVEATIAGVELWQTLRNGQMEAARKMRLFMGTILPAGDITVPRTRHF